MAEKGFGVKEINLIGASGTPTIESPNNLNLNAVNVAISTNVSIGGTLTVSGNVSVGGTLTYEDVTNIDSVGIITARSVIHAGAGLTVTGITTFRSDVNFGDYLGGNGAPIITFDESSDLLWFKKQTAGGSSSKIWLGDGTSYDNLQLQQTYTGGGQSEITAFNSDILIACNNTGKNITIQSQNDLTLANGVYPFIKGEKNSSSDQSVTLYYGQTGSTPYANPKLETTSTGIDVTGAITVNGSATSAWTVGHNGASNYVISGPGGLSNANNPDLYLQRGQTYQFLMNASGHGFGIQTSSGTWNSSNAYTTGITNAGAATGTITFAVPYSAPERLYYACTSLHSGMVGNIYIRGAGGNTGTTLQRQFKYLIDTGQLTKGGSISELNTNLRIPFTPKFANSNLLMEFDTSYVSPNTSNLYYCLFYDVTNSAGVSLPAAAGSRVRCHWTQRTRPFDANDNNHLSMRIVTPANNTNARTYTIHFGSEGATAQFFVSTLATGGGSTFPMTFTITEIAA